MKAPAKVRPPAPQAHTPLPDRARKSQLGPSHCTARLVMANQVGLSRLWMRRSRGRSLRAVMLVVMCMTHRRHLNLTMRFSQPLPRAPLHIVSQFYPWSVQRDKTESALKSGRAGGVSVCRMSE
jgi:hypothetical protein